ncbi:MAG: adenosylcobinamide-phosphate synthase CbiB [Firmicutes bacterium]|nr:adenosylcobinamide-phosphate synthase CbiB [Bacillota bacterium]
MWDTIPVATLGLLLDRVIGDPLWLPHPVVGIGRLIAFLERRWNRPDASPRRRRWSGVALVVVVVFVSTLIPWLIVAWFTAHVRWLADLLEVWMVATTIAWKGLRQAGQAVFRELACDDLVGARSAVGMIVGRDTASLPEQEVVRATVETLAENLVDAIVSPVFFALLGGAPLAWCYRSVNTLDSMVGYKNARYEAFGFASARLDDLLNYIPARLTALLLWGAMTLRAGSGVARRGWRIYRRDAHKHPSPNGGIPEAMVAGALGVQLGGENVYQGVMSLRARMGDAERPLARGDIKLVTGYLDTASVLLALIGLLVSAVAWVR